MADTSQVVTRKLILLGLDCLSTLQRLDKYQEGRPERHPDGVVHFATCPVQLDGFVRGVRVMYEDP